MIQSTTGQVIVTTVSIGGFLRTLLLCGSRVQFGPMNVSSFLQVALLTDLRFDVRYLFAVS